MKYDLSAIVKRIILYQKKKAHMRITVVRFYIYDVVNIVFNVAQWHFSQI